MLISEEIFEDFLNCKTKSYLKSLKTVESQSEFINWQRQLHENYKQKCQEKLRSFFKSDECISGILLIPKNITNKYQLLIDCLSKTDEIHSHINALERVTPHNSKQCSFIPIRFIPREKITKKDKLLLAFDAFVLFSVFGKMPQFGKIIHGKEQKVLRVTLTGLMKTARSTIKKIVAQQSNDNSPELILNKHCIECEFYSRCRSEAEARDDLSLLSGMSEKQREKEHNRGIFSVAQLSYTFRPRKKSKSSTSKSEKYHHSLKALAIRE